jgi:phosphoribosylformylglycinamidine synthase PurS subunit
VPRLSLPDSEASFLPDAPLYPEQKFLAFAPFRCNILWQVELVMKAKIVVTPKKAVLDPQGKTVQSALEHMGYKGVNAVHVGKYLEIELSGSDKEYARQQIDAACRKFLTNPVIEDFQLEIVD